jgi:hypothetical protein
MSAGENMRKSVIVCFLIFVSIVIANSQITNTLNLKINSAHYIEPANLQFNASNTDTSQGARSKSSIIRVVINKIPELKHEYEKELKRNPELKGKILTKFAINDSGKVVFVDIIESELNNVKLEKKIIDKVKMWEFEIIDKKGDITVVLYPFLFSK